jgi:translin
LAAVHGARETALRGCRTTIQASGRSIRAIHRGETDVAAHEAARAEEALRQAQEVLASHPAIAAAGFLHDAEKEYAEACLFEALVGGRSLPGFEEVRIGPAAWLNGLAEAASELRRFLLDRLREGRLDTAEALLGAMDDVYGVLIAVDYPDAVTGGLRRTTDALRAVLERTRSDLTTTVLQYRLQTALMEHQALS